jgi:hypothetical protein
MKVTDQMNTPATPGQHLGALPEDADTLAEIQRMNARGWDTTTSTVYEAMLAAGIEPDALRTIGSLA